MRKADDRKNASARTKTLVRRGAAKCELGRYAEPVVDYRKLFHSILSISVMMPPPGTRRSPRSDLRRIQAGRMREAGTGDAAEGRDFESAEKPAETIDLTHVRLVCFK